MMSRLSLIAALVIASAALNAAPAVAADSIPGNRGLAEKPQNRDAPLVLPGTPTPQPTPQVDAASLSSGLFDMDQADALAGLATVTLSSDGSLTETPASSALRGLFENEVQGHKATH